MYLPKLFTNFDNSIFFNIDLVHATLLFTLLEGQIYIQWSHYDKNSAITFFLMYFPFEKVNKNTVWERPVDWGNKHFFLNIDRVTLKFFREVGGC